MGGGFDGGGWGRAAAAAGTVGGGIDGSQVEVRGVMQGSEGGDYGVRGTHKDEAHYPAPGLGWGWWVDYPGWG